MSSKPKILFVYDHPKPDMWMDGLWAALNVLEKDFEIERCNLSVPGTLYDDFNDYDFVLGWGAFGSMVDRIIKAKPTSGNAKNVTSGLCIAGNAIPPNHTNSYDVLFYETKWYRPQISYHPNIVHAFGVNMDIFSPPTIPVPAVWDYIGVGALANWKRWEKMVDKPGKKLVIGEYQEGNETESLEIARKLIKGGVMVSNMVNPLDLVNLYYWSRSLYMPADINGGGERAIWEAKACNRNVEIESDNPKLQELVDAEVKDHHWYAKQLKKGILSVL